MFLEVGDDSVSPSGQSSFRDAHNAANEAQRKPNDNKHVKNPAVIFLQVVEGVSECFPQRDLFQYGLFGVFGRGARHECFNRRKRSVERRSVSPTAASVWEQRVVGGFFPPAITHCSRCSKRRGTA